MFPSMMQYERKATIANDEVETKRRHMEGWGNVREQELRMEVREVLPCQDCINIVLEYVLGEPHYREWLLRMAEVHAELRQKSTLTKVVYMGPRVHMRERFEYLGNFWNLDIYCHPFPRFAATFLGDYYW